ncbi:oxidoreductase [Stratiformator vulcanicus]|uniref:NADPH dehydrogenase n=1 Tax=Stratiformator vulcanicus TaxID=2527980 RepID=A0A517R4T0_9PLAN|nr:NADH:flavin oxidoreductase [Stratiformator vulcanicus]QDT38833.1 NADPH dehydrogenase [Stratiformator vulcanicus]
MARYFKFKSLSDLSAAAEELGDAIELTEDFSPLFKPVEIGARTAGNRLAIQPMEGCDGTLDGRPDELTYRRYQRFGAGGAKIIWGEATAIADEGRMNPRQLWINEKNLPDLDRMLLDCRGRHREQCGTDDDLVLGLQLTHSGRYSFRKPLLAMNDPALAEHTIDKSTGKAVGRDYPLLSDDDLKRIEDQFVSAAHLAFRIGVDFIDLKQCHRYLLSELLGAKNRPGEYGGSFENRTRLIRNVVGRIRDELPDLLIASRVNLYDGVPYVKDSNGTGVPVPQQLPLKAGFGVNIDDAESEESEEPLELCRQLEAWGVTMLNVSAGNPYAAPHYVRPAEFAPVDGYDAPEHPLLGVLRHFRLTRAAQQAVSIPVIGSGYSWLQDFAPHAGAANVAAGNCAIVGIGRGALSHPDFAETLRETGSLRRKSVCRTFSYCTNLMRAKDHPLGQYPTGCPPFDKEVYGPIWDEVKTRREEAASAE